MLEHLSHIAVGCVLAIPLFILNLKLAPRFGLIDWPKARGVAEEQIPIIGHTLVVISVAYFALVSSSMSISPWFISTSLIMAVMGHFDDQKPVPSIDKLFFQLICVVAVVMLDPQLRESIAARYGMVGNLWAIFFILGLMNAINFVDGIDGLAGLVIGMGAFGFLLLSHNEAQSGYAAYAGVLIGMLIPFLYLNVVKRKGFLGNVGSYFLSYSLAVMHLSLPIETGSALTRLSMSGLCFLVPIADALMVIGSRTLTLRSPFQADKGHLHHRLVQTSIPLRYVLLTFAVLEIIGLGAVYQIDQIAEARNSFLPLTLVLSFCVMAGVLIYMIEKASKRRLQAFFDHLDGGESAYFFKYTLKDQRGLSITPDKLKRLEARIHAEIRIHDLCFSRAPDTIFVILRTMSQPLQGISTRLEQIFVKEKLSATLLTERGQIVKLASHEPPVRKTA